MRRLSDLYNSPHSFNIMTTLIRQIMEIIGEEDGNDDDDDE